MDFFPSSLSHPLGFSRFAVAGNADVVPVRPFFLAVGWGRCRVKLALSANNLGGSSLESLGEISPLHGWFGPAAIGDEADPPSQDQELCGLFRPGI